MLELPLGVGRVPRLQSALRQIGRDEEAELREAAARQGSGERHVQRMPEPRRRGLGYSKLNDAPEPWQVSTPSLTLPLPGGGSESRRRDVRRVGVFAFHNIKLKCLS